MVKNRMKSLIRYGLPAVCLLLFLWMEMDERLSPLPARDWNTVNLRGIQVADPENFAFAVFGDNRNSKVVFETLLKRIDHDPEIAFAISLGDQVHQGNKKRYRWFLEQVMTGLGIPLLSVPGNHELRGNGRSLYAKVFGPSHYSFQIGRSKFLFIDDADGRGLDPEQRRWLEKELAEAEDRDGRMVFMHVPLYDPTGEWSDHRLPRESAETLIGLFQKYRVTRIFASHIHGLFQGRWQGIPFAITGGAGAPSRRIDPKHAFFHFLKVRVQKGNIEVEVRHLPAPLPGRLGRLSYLIWIHVSSFWRFYGIQVLLLSIAAGSFMIIHRKRAKKGRSFFQGDGKLRRQGPERKSPLHT